jgi:hypothetical protein
LPGRHELEVIDIYQHTGQLAAGHVVVAPTLMRQSPLPVRRLIGDLTNRNRVMEGLGIISPPCRCNPWGCGTSFNEPRRTSSWSNSRSCSAGWRRPRRRCERYETAKRTPSSWPPATATVSTPSRARSKPTGCGYNRWRKGR